MPEKTCVSHEEFIYCGGFTAVAVCAPTAFATQHNGSGSGDTVLRAGASSSHKLTIIAPGNAEIFTSTAKNTWRNRFGLPVSTVA